MNDLKVFSGRANRPLAGQICEDLGVPIGRIALANFPDGEVSVKIEENVRGCDVFLVQPTCPPVNEHLMELLIIIDSLKRASAERVTAVVPYFGYARQDRKDEGRVPITSKLAANLISTAGADRVLTMDLHAAQIQGFFDVPVDHLYAAPVINDYFLSLNLPAEELVVVSPDEGAIKRTLPHVEKLGGELAIVDKRRTSASQTKQANLIGGRIEGKVALLFDDMITTAGSIVGAARLVKDRGARSVYVCATHGILCGPAVERLRDAPIEQTVVTNTVPVTPERTFERLKILSVAPLLAKAVKAIHRHESVSALFD
jgi:ribose-phosphate pyrophosphokinase